jgi:glucoamylase
MSRELMASPEDKEIVHDVEQVENITLTGAARLFVLDAAAIWSPGGDDAAEAILRKLNLLARQNSVRVLVRSVQDRQAAALQAVLPVDRLVLERSASGVDLRGLLSEQGVSAAECFAMLAAPGASPVPEACTAFYVGQGAAPAHTHPTRLPGAHATDFILALYGTALAQERAGIAFRNISQGKGIPPETPFSRETLQSVVRAAERPSESRPASRATLPDPSSLRALAARVYARLMRNVLGNGAVVGSPAQGKEPGQPNYWFYWQRDGSVTMGHLIDWHQRPPLGLVTSGLGPFIERFPKFVAETQRNGQLGTSRYTVEGKPIAGFGNPQLDGPALSALALARLADPARAWEQLRRYLDFLLTSEGQGPSMDVWEFIYGRHFNAEFHRRRALLVGAEVASRLGHHDDAARYIAEARRVETGLADFVDAKLGRLVAYRETHNPWFETISRLDMSVTVALLDGWRLRWKEADGSVSRVGDTELGRDLDSLANPAVLATMLALEDDYASFFDANRRWIAAGNAGHGLGRFPEDANDGLGTSGGNPWPLATLWAAQFYYHLTQEIVDALETAASSLTLRDPRQVAFFQQVAGDIVEPGRPIDVTLWRERLLPTLLARGDGYLNFVVHHMPEDGSVTEQLDRDTGAPRGARDLSWALSELIATITLREEVYPTT